MARRHYALSITLKFLLSSAFTTVSYGSSTCLDELIHLAYEWELSYTAKIATITVFLAMLIGSNE